MTLVPWNGLPECKTKRNYEKNGEVAPCRPDVHAHLSQASRRFTGRPAHTAGGLRPVTDAVLCLALVGPSAVQTQALWVAEPAWVPRFVTTSQPSPCSGRVDGSGKFSTAEATEAARLVRLFIALPKKGQGRAPLKHGAAEPGDATNIECRRCDRPRDRVGVAVLKRHALGTRRDDVQASHYRFRGALADNLADRRRLYDLLADLYALRSTAVHTGALDETFSRSGTGKKRRRVKQLLTDGYALRGGRDQAAACISPAGSALDVALG